MSSIGGPGGVGGPKGPGEIDRAAGPSEVAGTAATTAAERAAPGELERIAADVASGKLTAQQAIDHLLDQIAGGADLPAPERAELRDMLTELVANDPYLSSLLGRI
jgi:hypothetical protein